MNNGNSRRRKIGKIDVFLSAVILIGALLSPFALPAQQTTTGNQVMCELLFSAKTKAEKNSSHMT